MPYTTDGSYSGIVISCERKLSGTERITAKIGGVYAELRFDDGLEKTDITPGASFTATGKFKEPVSAGNPGEFDYQEYLKSKGIRYLFYADSIALTDGPSKTIKKFLSFPEFCFKIRKSLFDRFTFGRNDEDKGLLAAVCLGDTSLADDSISRDFKMAGCSHLLAVSGTHFAGFLIVLPYVLAAICPDRRKSSVIYTFFAFLTACITGWSESVTRSSIMSSCAFTGKDSVSAMSAAAMVMLAADPFCSCRTGFLLSFSACISIKLLSGRIREILSYIKIKKTVVLALSAQIAALIGIMPFTGIAQRSIGPVQFIAQALGSLLAKNACMMFVPGLILSLVLPKQAALAVSAPSSFFLVLLKNIVITGADYSLKTAGKPAGMLAILCLWVFLVVRLLPRFAFKKVLNKACYCLVAVCLGFVLADIVKPVKAEIIFADVGQGDCCLIIADSKTCLIDAGTYEKGDSNVSNLLDYYGIDSVDVAFMTHWDQDHAGGIAALNQSGRIKKIYTGFTGNDEDTNAFEKSLVYRKCDPSAFRSSINMTRTGDVFDLSDNVSLKVIYPEECKTGGNPGSLVIILDCCGKEILFTGDIGLETEDLLVSEGIIHDIDILKVSHHGSKYASGSAFLNKAKPELSVISAGRNNIYGHPSPATLSRLNEAGSKVYRVDLEGAVIMEFY